MATADLHVFGTRPAASRYTKDGGGRPPSFIQVSARLVPAPVATMKTVE